MTGWADDVEAIGVAIGCAHPITADDHDAVEAAPEALARLTALLEAHDIDKKLWDGLADELDTAERVIAELREQLEAQEQELTRLTRQGLTDLTETAHKLDKANAALAALHSALDTEREPEAWRCSRCGGDSLSFSRTLCACGSMHHYCGDCGVQAEDCDAPDAALDTETRRLREGLERIAEWDKPVGEDFAVTYVNMTREARALLAGEPQ